MIRTKLSHVVLLGPPNSGKTTLFNHLTGRNSKTVNYPGSTVEFEQGSMCDQPNIQLIDVPGIHSLSPESEDEKRRYEEGKVRHVQRIQRLKGKG